MRCQNCNQTVTRKTKFCPNCGEKISARQSSRNVETSPTLSAGRMFGLIGIGIVIGIIVIKFSTQSSNQIQAPASNFQSSPSMLQSSAVLDVAKEFMCFCGKCGDRLDTCQCNHKNGAADVKGFIAQQIQAGHQKPHIVELVQAKYGVLQQINQKPLFNPDNGAN